MDTTPQIEVTYIIDPLIASVLPSLEPANFQALKDGIKSAGEITSKLIVWEETGILLDGHFRDRARKELIAEGIDIPCPQIKPMSFRSKADAALWALHNAQGTRQNFGTFQKIHQIVSNPELMETLSDKAQKRMRHEKVEPGATVAPGSDEETAKVTTQLAKIVGCSETTAKEALAVCRDGQLVAAVQSGDVTAHSAYRAIRGHAHRQQKHEQVTQNLEAAHVAVKVLADAGTLLGKVHHSDVLVGLRQLPDSSISAVITSPPYPLKAVKYPNWEYLGDYPAYLKWMAEVFAECKRVLVTGGKLIVNFDNVNIPPAERKGNEVRRDCRRDFANIIGDLNLIYVDEYFWAKQNAIGTRPAIGTKGKPSGHRVNNNCEYVCIWAKDQVQKAPERVDVPEQQLIDLTVTEQFELSMQFWMIKPANRSATKHRAAFPDELARRLVRLYTYLGDTVCDPFSGSGTTCAMAARMGRRFVGFDNALEHLEISDKRIAEALENPIQPPATPNWEFKREMKRARNSEMFRASTRTKKIAP